MSQERSGLGRFALLRVVQVVGRATEQAEAAADDANRLLREAVANAREGGATWADVGDALGINGEAAAKRFRR